MNTNKTANALPQYDVIEIRAIDLSDDDLKLLESVKYVAPLSRRISRPTELTLVEKS